MDREDLLQEILLAIHKAGHTYNTERPFKAWMFAVASHKVNDYLRSHYRKGIEVDFEEIEPTFADNVTYEPPHGELLDEMLGILPEKQQRIVRMIKIEGHSINHTATILKMSIPAVKVAAHRAYKALIARHRKEN